MSEPPTTRRVGVLFILLLVVGGFAVHGRGQRRALEAELPELRAGARIEDVTRLCSR